jgi:type VII secretion protein EccB
MASRTDQLQSYQFLTQRVIAALVMRETDPRQSPLRRGIGAVFAGLMIAVMIGAGFGVYGLLTKVGGSDWKTSGAVIIEKETGASFVYLSGVLYPTLNYTSALLASGQPSPQVFRVATNALATVPRGTTVGIAGAPDSLPAADHQVGLPWTVCVVPGLDSSGHPTTSVALAASVAPIGGHQLGDDALLVKDSRNGTTYLVWHGRRHRITSAATVTPALFGAVSPQPVGNAWLNSLAPGVDIGPIGVSDLGNPSHTIAGRVNGEVLVTQTGSGPQYYVVQDDGLTAITALQETIVTAVRSYVPVTVDLSQVGHMPRSARQNPTGPAAELPDRVPDLAEVTSTDTICAVTHSVQTEQSVVLGATVAGLAHALPTVRASDDGVPLVDGVLIPAGHVEVVRVLGSPSDQTPNYAVITDTGIRYPVSSAQVLPLLGYSAQQAVEVPAELVNRIPSGPTLDPAAAMTPAQSGN